MVEAAGPAPRARSDEAVQERPGQLVEAGDAALGGEVDEQPKGRLLGQILAAEGALVGEEPVDGASEAVVHDSTASPSPSATSRSASTATLA